MHRRPTNIMALVALVALAAAAPTHGQGTDTSAPPPDVRWYSFDEGVAAALAEGKHIMVDVYTDWCGWCKKLDSETYADPDVRQVLAASYISVKLKGDSRRRLNVQGQQLTEDGRALLKFVPTDKPAASEQELTRGMFRVTGYPTILFLTPDGKLITKLPGFHDAASFQKIINFVKDDLYEVMSYQDYLKSLEVSEETDQDKS